MKILDRFGRPRTFNPSRYLIKWDAKSKSKPQEDVKQFLKMFWSNDIVLEELRIPSSLFRLDFFNATRKIVVEVHGRQHEKYVKHFHRSKAGYLASFKRDAEKYEWIEKNGFKFIEIFQDEIKDLSRQYLIDKFNIDII